MAKHPVRRPSRLGSEITGFSASRACLSKPSPRPRRCLSALPASVNWCDRPSHSASSDPICWRRSEPACGGLLPDASAGCMAASGCTTVRQDLLTMGLMWRVPQAIRWWRPGPGSSPWPSPTCSTPAVPSSSITGSVCPLPFFI